MSAAWTPIACGLYWALTRVGGLLARAWCPVASVAKILTPARAGLLVGELVFVGLALGFSYLWGWWLDGERVTGRVVEISGTGFGPSGEVTIQDPYLDHATVVPLPLGTRSVEVGDTVTAVLKRPNPTVAATPATLVGYLALWMTLPVGAVAWLVWWWLGAARLVGRPRPRLRRGGSPRHA